MDRNSLLVRPMALWPALRRRNPAKAEALNKALATAQQALPTGVVAWAMALPQPLLESAEDFADLLPSEIVRAAPRRVASYLAGRLCAEHALAKFGVIEQVGREVGGAPLWPAGYVGSITHNDQFACAAVASNSSAHALGIDSEIWLDDSAFEAVMQTCLTKHEQRRCRESFEARRECTAIFSAKEAFYKAAYPHLKRWIGFEEVEVQSVDFAGGTLSMRSTGAADCAAFLGGCAVRVAATATMVATSVVMPCRH